MKNIIVVSFTDETKAINAMHKLVELESYGDISIYEKVMVRKNANGECEVLREDSFEGWRTLTGMGIGSLLGALGGPVGFAIGMYTGTTIGLLGDIGHYDFADDFVAKTKNKLTAGTVSIIAEVDEDSDAFVDTSLKPFDAVISRTSVDAEYDNFVNEKIDKIEDDIAAQRAALKNAIGSEKAKIQAKIAELKAKRKATIAEFEANAKAAEESLKEKATAVVKGIQADVTDFVNTMNQEINEERAAWIKSRIARHEERLKDLKKQLSELTPQLVNH